MLSISVFLGCSPWSHEQSDTTEWLHFHLYALEKEMATHSSVLAWRIPGTREPGGLPSMGSHRVGHNWVTSQSLFTYMHWRRKWHPTPVFLPGEFQGQGSLVGCHLWSRTESDATEATQQQQQHNHSLSSSRPRYLVNSSQNVFETSSSFHACPWNFCFVVDGWDFSCWLLDLHSLSVSNICRNH